MICDASFVFLCHFLEHVWSQNLPVLIESDPKTDVNTDPPPNHHFKVPGASQKGKCTEKAHERVIWRVVEVLLSLKLCYFSNPGTILAPKSLNAQFLNHF